MPSPSGTRTDASKLATAARTRSYFPSSTSTNAPDTPGKSSALTASAPDRTSIAGVSGVAAGTRPTSVNANTAPPAANADATRRRARIRRTTTPTEAAMRPKNTAYTETGYASSSPWRTRGRERIAAAIPVATATRNPPSTVRHASRRRNPSNARQVRAAVSAPSAAISRR